MALTLGDNFSYQGAKPLDARLKYDTLAAMKAVGDATMYDGCMAYCSATDKTYQWKSSNTVDPDTGKWREFSSGGGGGSTYTAGDGIVIENDEISIDPMPAEDMDDVIDELPTGGNIAVTGYVPLGTLIPFYGETAPKFFLACDGSTYNKVDYSELAKHLLSLTYNTPYVVDGDNTKFKVPDLRGEFIRGTGTNSHTNQGSGENVGVHQDGTEIPHSNAATGGSLTYRTVSSGNSPTKVDGSVGASNTYGVITPTSTGSNSYIKAYTTRPTNTSVLFCIAYKDIYSNPMNDYSTDEKVVGTWIDGKPIYQKTIDCGALPNKTSKSVAHNISNIDIVTSIEGIAVRPDTHASYPLPKVSDANASQQVNIMADRQNIDIDGRNGDASVFTQSYITIQYTKTTD